MMFLIKKLILLLTSHKKLTKRQSVTILWRKEKKIPWFFPGLYSCIPRMLSRRTSTRLRYTVVPLDSFTLFTLGSRGFFFLSIMMVRHETNVSGALSNRKHGLFHIKYFENGPLEPGYTFVRRDFPCILYLIRVSYLAEIFPLKLC